MINLPRKHQGLSLSQAPAWDRIMGSSASYGYIFLKQSFNQCRPKQELGTEISMAYENINFVISCFCGEILLFVLGI
jgi:hypothetical protein